MKHISIMVPRGAAALGCIEGAYKAFTMANEFLANKGKQPLFKVQLVGIDKEPQVYDSFFRVHPDLTIEDSFKTDLIIIPAVNGDWKQVVEINKDFYPWINKQYHSGGEVASLCVGTFLLASTGLLEGKKCATHWLAEHAFRQMFPEAILVSEKIITDEKGIYCSGGANSFWNLLIYILEKYTDRELSILAAKYFEIEIDRYSQSSFVMFRGQKEHEDEPVRKAQEFIETNFQEKISVDQLSDLFAVGRRSFERRFKKATSNTITEYIQRVKIEAAKKNLETTRKNISEIMFDVGYTDSKAFRDVFRKITGMTPIDYRNKYNKQMVTY